MIKCTDNGIMFCFFGYLPIVITPHSTMIATGHVSNIICITELRNNPKAACTHVNTTEKGSIELFPPDLYLIF